MLMVTSASAGMGPIWYQRSLPISAVHRVLMSLGPSVPAFVLSNATVSGVAVASITMGVSAQSFDTPGSHA